jgi:ketosteroid isomerase-like protein
VRAASGQLRDHPVQRREKPLENNLAHVVRLRDGLIAESWLHSRDQYAVDEFWGEPAAVAS